MEFLAEHIAPCGANCMICLSFLRAEDGCPGCRFDGSSKPVNCTRCRIKNCRRMRDGSLKFCYECEKFPCPRMRQLDERYRRNYRYSMIDSLVEIREEGMDQHIQNDNERWSCETCGGTICVHRGYCISCGKIRYCHAGNHRARIRTDADSSSTLRSEHCK